MENKEGSKADKKVTEDTLLSRYDSLVESISRGENPDANTIKDIREHLTKEVSVEPDDPNFTSLVSEWMHSEDESDLERMEEEAQKYHISILQVAKIEAGVWKGTYTPAKYGDPRALNMVREVAREIGRDDAVKGVIQDFTGVKFDEGISIQQALVVLPDLMETLDRRAAEMIGGVLRKILPDSIIVDRKKANEAIKKEFEDN